jgi:hypothetical protein
VKRIVKRLIQQTALLLRSLTWRLCMVTHEFELSRWRTTILVHETLRSRTRLDLQAAIMIRSKIQRRTRASLSVPSTPVFNSRRDAG